MSRVLGAVCADAGNCESVQGFVSGSSVDTVRVVVVRGKAERLQGGRRLIRMSFLNRKDQRGGERIAMLDKYVILLYSIL
jgi:hypothetical protein